MAHGMDAESARKVCLLISMALEQEVEMKKRDIPVPAHLQVDNAQLSKLLRKIASWIEDEHGLEKFVSTLLEGESALAQLENGSEL